MADVTMPRLSDSMEEGTIVRWLKADGDEVEAGEDLVEIETDKATMTYEADAAGTLRILAAEGDTLPLGALIARIGAQEPSPARSNGPRREAVPAAATAPSTPPRPAAPGELTAAARLKASPVARRLAAELGVDLASLSGTGPRGRIVKADVGAAAGAPTPSSAPAAPARPDGARGAVRVVELSRTQQVIARRMAEAKATVPEFTLTVAVDLEAAVALRAELKALAGEDRAAPSYNDMVVKASALALRESPRANGSYRGDRFELHERVNVGVAVAGEDTLVVPTVFDADRKSLGEIAAETRALAAAVRDGSVTPAQLEGGTFTVSNLGMYGVDEFEAVINPPQAAILAVGALRPSAVVVDGRVAPRALMRMTLTCDHRILYGADAAQFLARVRELLERPLSMAL